MTKKNKTTGIHLEERVPSEGRLQGEAFFGLIPVCCMILGVYGWLRVSLGMAAIAWHSSVLPVCILGFGVWFGCIYLIKKRQLALIILSLAVFVLFLWKNLEPLQEGLYGLAHIFMTSVSQVPESSGPGIELTSEAVLAMAGILFVLYCIFFWCLCTESGKYFAVLWMLVPVSAALIFGQVPDGTGVFCLAFTAIGMNVAGSGERPALWGKSACIAGILALALLLVGHLAAEPVLGPWFTEKMDTRARIQQTSLLQEMLRIMPKWENGQSKIASGGISEGTLNDTDFFLNTGETLFTISQVEEPQDNLYLRVYTGTEYTGKQWKKGNDKEPAAEIFYGRAAVCAYARGYNSPCSLAVSVAQEKSNSRFSFAPYFSRYQGGNGGVLYQYAYFPLNTLGPLFTEAADDQTEDYRAYVYDTYLSYPAERLPRFQKFCEENPGTDPQKICERIKSMLQQNASYNPQAGRFPEEEEFAEYFVYEKKEGYCVHFATAAVLLARMYGIPARYVTGFAVPAGDFVWDGSAWAAEVKDSRAHAWAEIYVDNLGWVPFETTPSYDSGASMVHGETGQTQQQDIAEEESTQSQESEKRNKQTENESGRAIGNKGGKKDQALDGSAGIGAFGFALVLLVLGTVAVFVRRSMVLKKRSRKSVPQMFRDIYEVLVFAGMPDSLDCMDENFTAKVTEQFVWISKEELDGVMDIVMRASFSGDILQKEEILQVRGMYRHICRTVLKGIKGVRRWYFRFVRVYL